MQSQTTVKNSSISLKKYSIVFSFLFVFFIGVNFANAESYVYLKSSSGVLMGRITYEKTFINEYIKINAFCAYKNITEGVSCEYVDEQSPIANNPDGAVVLVRPNAGDTSGIWGAIGRVSGRLDGFIKTVTGRTPDTIVVPVNNTPNNSQPTPAPTQTGTTSINYQQVENTTVNNTPATGNFNPSTSPTQQNIVYQVIERAVPGPQGPQGPAGAQGPAGSSGSAGTASYSIGGQYNSSATDPSGNGNLTSLNVSGGTNLNSLNYTTANGSTTNTINLNATNASITNLSASSFGVATLTSANINASTTNTDNLNATNASITNSTSTNLFSSSILTTLLNAISAYIGTLFGNSSNFLVSNASTTNATTSNSQTANIQVANIGTTNTTNLNATGTSQLTTIYASTTNASTTNTSNLNATNGTVTNSTSTNLNTTNLTAESILFKVTSSSALLSKSELFRMKYFKRIKEALSVEQLEDIKKDMFSEMNVRI